MSELYVLFNVGAALGQDYYGYAPPAYTDLDAARANLLRVMPNLQESQIREVAALPCSPADGLPEYGDVPPSQQFIAQRMGEHCDAWGHVDDQQYEAYTAEMAYDCLDTSLEQREGESVSQWHDRMHWAYLVWEAVGMEAPQPPPFMEPEDAQLWSSLPKWVRSINWSDPDGDGERVSRAWTFDGGEYECGLMFWKDGNDEIQPYHFQGTLREVMDLVRLMCHGQWRRSSLDLIARRLKTKIQQAREERRERLERERYERCKLEKAALNGTVTTQALTESQQVGLAHSRWAPTHEDQP